MLSLSAPRTLLGALELPRTVLELGALFASGLYLQLVQRGDDHPVMVLPGFTAGDDSTRTLRRYLASIGYDARPWNLGRNLGLRQAGGIDELHEQVETLHQQTGKRVSLIGWSLGGVHARNAAKRLPDRVRQVISLGSPFGSRRVATSGTDPAIAPPTVPCTAIYSRSDGVVAWQSAMETPGPLTDNIEVYGSHCGLGFNSSVYYAIADRLAQPDGEFAQFSRTGWRAAVYGPASPA